MKDEFIKNKMGFLPPVGWNVKKLGKLFEFKNGVNAGKEAYGEGVKFVNVMDVFDNTFITHDKIIGSVTLTGKQKKKNLLKKGDILFNRTSEVKKEIGMSAVYNDNNNAVFGGFVIRGRPINNDLLPEFSVYGFQSENVRRQIISKGQGAVRVNIGQSDLRQVLFPIPPIHEQKTLVEILSTWDKTISTLKVLIQAKKRYKKGLMQQLLLGKKRFPEFEGEPWVEVKLGDVFDERKEKDYAHLGLVAITTNEGVIDRDELDRRDTSSSKKDHYKRIVPSDIGYNTMRMWQGASGYSEIEGIVSPAYTIVKPIADKVDGRFMSYLFKLPAVVDLFRRYSQGLVSDTLNLKYDNFAQIKVLIPKSLKEQRKIGQVFMTVDKEIELLKEQVTVVKKQKKGLMQQLLTGKVRVNQELTKVEIYD